HDGGHQRLADEELRAPAIVEQGDVRALTGEEDGERRSRGPRAHDRHPERAGHARHGAGVHPRPSRITSMIRAASSSLTTSSIHDTTRFSRSRHRLKNTPRPGCGGTTGTW